MKERRMVPFSEIRNIGGGRDLGGENKEFWFGGVDESHVHIMQLFG